MSVSDSVLDGMKERQAAAAGLAPKPQPEADVYECMFVFWETMNGQGLFIRAYDPAGAAKIFLFNRLLCGDMADGPELTGDAGVRVRVSGTSEWKTFDVTVHLDQLFTAVEKN